jgi:hypothetical protein
VRDTISAARKRLQRFLFDDPERTDQILALNKTRQAEITDLVWEGRTGEARDKLAEYTAEKHRIRSEASTKSASVTFKKRRDRAVYKLLDAFGALASPRTVWKGSKDYTIDDLRAIEQRSGVDLVVWVQSKARIPVPFGKANPFWYH